MSDQPPKKAPQGHLRFSLQPRRGARLDGSGIPVEVRKPSLSLARRCLSTDVVDLDPGDYLVTAQLPSGQVLSGSIALPPGQDRTVQLEWEEDEPPPEPPWASPFRFGKLPSIDRMLSGQLPLLTYKSSESPAKSPGLLRCLIPSIPQASESADSRGAAWHLTEGARVTWRAIRFGSTTQREGHVELRAPEDHPTVVQFLQPRAVPLNLVLPITGKPEHPGCLILVERGSAGALQVDIRLDNSRADTLLRYSQAGDRERALLSQRELVANELLHGKRSDPVGAAISAYALLRFMAARDLPSWTEDLYERFPWFSDGAVIRAEHQARLGQHVQALRVLLLLEQRGLPLFSAGLTYAVDRLRAYTKSSHHSWPRGEAPGAAELQKARTLLASLGRYAAYADFSRLVTTYPGAQPFAPGEEPAPERLESAPTDVNLVSYFRD